MTEQQYKWQCPMCDVCLNFTPEPLPESLTLQIVEEVRKMNTSSYLIIMAERSQHMFNHALSGDGIGVLGQIKKELEKGDKPDKVDKVDEPKEELDEEAAPTLDAEKREEETPKEEQNEVERKEDLDDNTEQSGEHTPQGQGDDTSEDSESA